jgi:hypothetical protein
VRERGSVPAYATALGGEPVDVEPTQERKRTRRGRITAPEEPGEQISRDEFQELVRDLDVDAEPKKQKQGRAAVAQRPVEEQPEEQAAEPARDPAADLTPEDLVLKEDPKKRERSKRAGGRRNKRHGRSR